MRETVRNVARMHRCKIDQIGILVLAEVDVGGPKSDAQIYHIQNFHLQDDGLQNDESKF